MCQGAIGIGNTSTTASYGALGYLLCEYVVDFYSPTAYHVPVTGLSITSKPSVLLPIGEPVAKGVGLPERRSDEKKTFASALGTRVQPSSDDCPETSTPFPGVSIGHTTSSHSHPKRELFYRNVKGEYETVPDEESS
jgi:hypothetical protein